MKNVFMAFELINFASLFCFTNFLRLLENIWETFVAALEHSTLENRKMLCNVLISQSFSFSHVFSHLDLHELFFLPKISGAS